MDIIAGIILLIGVSLISIVISIIYYFIYHNFLTIYASMISREIQGLQTIPKPPLKNLVSLVKFLESKRDEIREQIIEEDEKDKYNNSYQ